MSIKTKDYEIYLSRPLCVSEIQPFKPKGDFGSVCNFLS